jgi:sigma-B regulation protein RsbU (phosphoserine phosphatase)
LDVNLPDGSGFDVCAALKLDASALAIPILFISASEDTSTKVKGFEMGGVDYITKPIVGAEVIARVRTHLRLKQAYERLAELHAERVERLASAQQKLMPRPEDFRDARFQVSIHQVLTAGGDFYDVIPTCEGVHVRPVQLTTWPSKFWYQSTRPEAVTVQARSAAISSA